MVGSIERSREFKQAMVMMVYAFLSADEWWDMTVDVIQAMIMADDYDKCIDC